ncbi:MAG: hypothetical protein RLZZ387_273 [Chloroflexota bacterium]|jgi:hypothetical protein
MHRKTPISRTLTGLAAILALALGWLTLSAPATAQEAVDKGGPVLIVTPTTASATEGGATGSFTVALNALPSTTVTVTLTGDAQVTPSPTTLTFTPSNGTTPQSVTVTAVDDAVAESTHSGTITSQAASSDIFNGLNGAPVTVTISDNDSAGVTVTPTSVSATEGGATGSYTVRLTSQPTANVTVAVTPNAQLMVNQTVLTFTSANYATPQTVTVTAVDDSAQESNHTGTIAHTATSSDTTYNGISITSVTANIADNDGPGLTFTSTPVEVGEGGVSRTYDVALRLAPTANVTVTLETDEQTVVSPTLLLFTPANFSTPQTVTVTAVTDLAQEAMHTSTITHTLASDDPAYDALTPVTVTATVTDTRSLVALPTIFR